MSDFYHKVLAFLEKQASDVKKGNPRAAKKLLYKCNTFAPEELYDTVDKRTNLGTMLLNHKDVLKDAVLFKTKQIKGVHYVDSDDIQLPYERTVFIIEGSVPLHEDYPDLISEIMVVCSEKDATQPARISIFVKHLSKRNKKVYTWTMIPYGIPLDEKTLVALSVYGSKNNPLKDRMQFGNKVTSKTETAIIFYAVHQLTAVLNRLNQQNYTIQTQQPSRSLYSTRGPGHHKFYEHRVIVIDPDKTVHREGDNSGLSGRKHALHAVRGFYRHLKKPKADGTTKIWIKPHWRGDKELGVVTKEYEVKKFNNTY